MQESSIINPKLNDIEAELLLNSGIPEFHYSNFYETPATDEFCLL